MKSVIILLLIISLYCTSCVYTAITNDRKCVSLGGSCTSTCTDGYFRRGLCPGKTAIKCCIKGQRPVIADDSKCIAVKGSCISGNCDNGEFKLGLCRGSAAIKCCVKHNEPTNNHHDDNSNHAPVPTPTPEPNDSGSSSFCFNEGGVKLVVDFEKFEPNFYHDQSGVKTIGYGSACNTINCNTIKAPITHEKATQLMVDQLKVKSSCVLKKLKPHVKLTSNQFSALVTFSYNIGCGGFAKSSVLKQINAGNVNGAAQYMLSWNKVSINGKLVTSRGLDRRRKAEIALYKSDKPHTCYFDNDDKIVIASLANTNDADDDKEYLNWTEGRLVASIDDSFPPRDILNTIITNGRLFQRNNMADDPSLRSMLAEADFDEATPVQDNHQTNIPHHNPENKIKEAPATDSKPHHHDNHHHSHAKPSKVQVNVEVNA